MDIVTTQRVGCSPSNFYNLSKIKNVGSFLDQISFNNKPIFVHGKCPSEQFINECLPNFFEIIKNTELAVENLQLINYTNVQYTNEHLHSHKNLMSHKHIYLKHSSNLIYFNDAYHASFALTSNPVHNNFSVIGENLIFPSKKRIPTQKVYKTILLVQQQIADINSDIDLTPEALDFKIKYQKSIENHIKSV